MRNKKIMLFPLLLTTMLLFNACGHKAGVSESNSSANTSEKTSSKESSTSKTSSKTSKESSAPSSEPAQPGAYNFDLDKEGTTRLEAELFDVTNHVISSANDTKIVEADYASGGKFLAAATGDPDYAGTFYFEITLAFPAEVTLTCAYAQTEKWKTYNEDMSITYNYLVDENRSLSCSKNYTLNARDDVTEWQEITYDSITLPEGKHTFTVGVKTNTQKGVPNLDYIDVNVKKVDGTVTPPADDPDVSEVPANDFHTLTQYRYANDVYTSIYDYGKGTAEDSAPAGITVQLDTADASSYIVQKASKADFSDAKNYNTTVKSYTFQNLMLGEHFYYRAAANEAGLASATVKEMTVATQAPRNVKVDGVHNFRDIGGWNSDLVEGGAPINQGLFYRCARFDTVTAAGKDTIINELGIDTEIDMRDSYQCTGPYISKDKGDAIDVKYVPASIPSGTEANRFSGYNDVWCKIFKEIAEQKGAIALHCTAGADRTGLAAYFLLTLIGASYEDVARDYLYTNLSDQGVRYIDSTHMQLWEDSLLKYTGATRAEKCKNVLIGKGVTEDQIETIRERYVPGYVKGQDPIVPVTPETPDTPTTDAFALVVGETKRYEVENATPTSWVNSGFTSGEFTASDASASNGKFVTASTGDTAKSGSFSFDITVPADGKVTLTAAYSQGENKKSNVIPMDQTYKIVAGSTEFTMTSETKDLAAISAVYDWRTFTYEANLTKGTHTITVTVKSNTGKGCACIDYFDFALEAGTPATPSDEPVTADATLVKGETVRYEVENATPTNWKSSGHGDSTTFKVEDANASGGAFVAASTGNEANAGTFAFTIYVPEDGKVTLTIAVSQNAAKQANTMAIEKIFSIKADSTEFAITGETSLAAISAAYDWRTFTYEANLTKGVHTITLSLKSGVSQLNTGTPCIDYFDFAM